MSKLKGLAKGKVYKKWRKMGKPDSSFFEDLTAVHYRTTYEQYWEVNDGGYSRSNLIREVVCDVNMRIEAVRERNIPLEIEVHRPPGFGDMEARNLIKASVQTVWRSGEYRRALVFTGINVQTSFTDPGESKITLKILNKEIWNDWHELALEGAEIKKLIDEGKMEVKE